MTIALNEIKQIQKGVSKPTFEKSLQHMSEQINWIDKKLTTNVDHVISEYFQDQQNETQYIQMMLERMRETL